MGRPVRGGAGRGGGVRSEAGPVQGRGQSEVGWSEVRPVWSEAGGSEAGLVQGEAGPRPGPSVCSLPPWATLRVHVVLRLSSESPTDL